MKRIALGISLMALTTLMMELVLTRVFDVILTPNMAYMIISCAMLSFGLSGVYAALRPLRPDQDASKYLRNLAALFALSTLAILPVTNVLPFDYERIGEAPVVQALSFGCLYLALVVPFFLSGLIFTTVFSAYSQDIQSLYRWDLAGAAVGCVILVPFLPAIGPGGLLFCAAALALSVSALFSRSRGWAYACAIGGLLLVLIPVAHAPDYYDFREHLAKRGVKEARELGKVELTRWDPISKIDVIDQSPATGQPSPDRLRNGKKHIAYDGGTQSSHIFEFDGNYRRLRDYIEADQAHIKEHFWHRAVLASHVLKQDTGQTVLVIGSAGGQETKAALMYGAGHVDAVEMVATVVDLGRRRYAAYNGNLFNDPRVRAYAAEGRSFLRASRDRYDIIQIFSNHTSSSIAAGTGAMGPSYLQTAEAYREYFEHLTPDGILHVNHHVYPKMVTTAALAWRQMGRRDFQKHVVVFDRHGIVEALPTLLVKMQPWTEEELVRLKALYLSDAERTRTPYVLVENPLAPRDSFLSPAFYNGHVPPELADLVGYHIEPATDDRPFFGALRKRLGPVEPDPEKFMNFSTAMTLNSQLRRGIFPMDIVHLVVTAVLSLVFGLVCICGPLFFAGVGRARWRNKYPAMVYFACLGAGFIIIELVFIQLFMKLVGSPLYTYSTVIFTLLLAAGIGSSASRRLVALNGNGWRWAFLGIGATGVLALLVYPSVFHVFLAWPVGVRILVAAAMIFPLGFFLGMPFPLGVLAIKDEPNGAIAWAWGLNGLFTVVGSLASVLLAVSFGFRVTVVIALGLYTLAFAALLLMKARAYAYAALVEARASG